MSLFRYTGRTDGQLVEGVLEGVNATAVARQLLDRRIEPLTIVASDSSIVSGAEWMDGLSGGWPGADDLILFARQMYALTKSGVPMARAFQGLTDSAVNLRMKNALERIAADLQGGRDLSAALAEHPRIFGRLFPRIIHIGEETGRLEESFRQLYLYLDVDKENRQRIQEAFRYPLFVLAALFIALFIINFYVIPAFAGLFSKFGADLPLMTRILLETSQFIRDSGPILLLAMLLAVYGFSIYIRQPTGRLWWDGAQLKIPLIGSIIHRATLARFARAFAMGSRSGLTAVQTLNATEEAVDNVYMGQRICKMREGVERGESLTQSAHGSGLLPPLMLQMMAVGEESGDMANMMSEVADFLEREVTYETRALSSVVEPILIIFVAILVLVLALGVFLPMWDLGSAALQ